MAVSLEEYEKAASGSYDRFIQKTIPRTPYRITCCCFEIYTTFTFNTGQKKDWHIFELAVFF